MSQRKNPELDAKHQAILRKMMYVILTTHLKVVIMTTTVF